MQNNLFNLEGVDAGTLVVVHICSGELLKTLDLPKLAGLMPESIETALGYGHDYHPESDHLLGSS